MKDPAAAELPPITVPSIAPAFISTVDNVVVPLPVIPALNVESPVTDSVPATTVLPLSVSTVNLAEPLLF